MKSEFHKRIGDYELLELIGDGAQGKIYKAIRAVGALPPFVAGPHVAVKVLRRSGNDETDRARFERESALLKSLSHTNIVRYLDSFIWHAGEWDEVHVLVMELLEGETLAQRLRACERGGLPWPGVRDYFEQCLQGLIYARSNAVLHRDIKPSNIFITDEGTVKLIDFEVARHSEDLRPDATTGLQGTFDYMAPEFALIPKFSGDDQSDIFSLGICIHEALSGSLPFPALGEGAQIGYLERWSHPGTVEADLSAGIYRVLVNSVSFIRKCLAADSRERFSDMTEVLEQFRKIQPRWLTGTDESRYELREYLGRGGTGEVFKAKRLSDRAAVAIKHLHGDQQAQRFMREAKILQQHPHEHLVCYIDFIDNKTASGQDRYLVLEYLAGMPAATLRNRLSAEGALDTKEALTLFGGYLTGLDFLHAQKHQIIHRDIKPGNLYAPRGQPERGKIFDLGIAKVARGTMTAGGVPGTLNYMPPEFAASGSERGSPQSDIYALGLCLYETVTGNSAVPKLPNEIQSAWLEFQDRPRHLANIDFSADVFGRCAGLQEVIQKAVSPSPHLRYESAAAMLLDVQAVLACIEGKAEEPHITVPAELRKLAENVDILFPREKRMPLPPEFSSSTRKNSGIRKRKAPFPIVSAAVMSVLALIVFAAAIYVREQSLQNTPTLDAAQFPARPSPDPRPTTAAVDVLENAIPEEQLIVAEPGIVAVKLQTDYAEFALEHGTVFINGDVEIVIPVKLPLTNYARTLPPGDYTVSVMIPGFAEVSLMPLTVLSGEQTILPIHLEAIPASLTLHSQPSDAMIKQNGTIRGQAGQPLALSPGQYVFDVEKVGYETHSEEILLRPGAILRKKVLLQPLPAQVQLTSVPPGAELWLDDNMVGVAGDTLELPPGEYGLILKRDGYRARSVELTVAPGAAFQKVYELNPLPCSFRITTEPVVAQVWYKDRFLGNAGEWIDNLPPAKYELELRSPDYRSRVIQVVLKNGNNLEIGPVVLNADVGVLRIVAEIIKDDLPPDCIQPLRGHYRLGKKDWQPFVSPLEVQRVISGRYHLEVKFNGSYRTPQPKEEDISFGKITQVFFPAVPLPSREAELQFLQSLIAGSRETRVLYGFSDEQKRRLQSLLRQTAMLAENFDLWSFDRRDMVEYQLQVGELLNIAAAFDEPFKHDLKMAIAYAVNRQFEVHAIDLVRGVALGGLSPMAQARRRRLFLELVAITKHRTGLTAGDVKLQESISRFFDDARFHPALLQRTEREFPQWESNVPWIEELVNTRLMAQQ